MVTPSRSMVSTGTRCCGIDAVRHAEQGAAAVVGAGLPASASPRRRSAGPRPGPRRRRFPRLRRAAAKACSVSGAPIRASSAARKRGAVEAGRDRGISSPPGAARTAACRRGSGPAPAFPAAGRRFPPRCRTASATNASRCGPRRDDQVGFLAAGQAVGGGAGGQQALVQRGVLAGQGLQELLVQPDQPFAAARSAKVKPKPSRNIGNSHGVDHFPARGCGCHRLRVRQPSGAGSRR